ncbi:eukaryotic translation initiation factor 3 subunit E-like [Papaver somniferum]|uniref:eukaryotic translation initiation factor 3 subunit E-like n=1 Tax=Papaver somniferum TaxID=3469 RepID=UPI000E6FBFA7|nr:eukaryotic translation initiation factor 3 subunit E-like [Papaver somniferum]
MNFDEAERWIVNLVQNAKLDAKIDSKLGTVVMEPTSLNVFMPIRTGAEKDLRFVYCAAAISYLLNDDWSGMDIWKAKEYIVNCQPYDGGFLLHCRHGKDGQCYWLFEENAELVFSCCT